MHMQYYDDDVHFEGSTQHIENANFICRKTKNNKKELDAIKRGKISKTRQNLAHLQNFPRFEIWTIKTTTTDYKSPVAHSLPFSLSLFNQQKEIKEVKLCNNVRNLNISQFNLCLATSTEHVKAGVNFSFFIFYTICIEFTLEYHQKILSAQFISFYVT